MFKKLYFNNEERQNNTVVQTFFPIILEIKPKKIFKSIHVIWKYIFKTWEANLVLLPSKTTTTSSSLSLKSWSEISECGRPLSPMLGEGHCTASALIRALYPVSYTTWKAASLHATCPASAHRPA